MLEKADSRKKRELRIQDEESYVVPKAQLFLEV